MSVCLSREEFASSWLADGVEPAVLTSRPASKCDAHKLPLPLRASLGFAQADNWRRSASSLIQSEAALQWGGALLNGALRMGSLLALDTALRLDTLVSIGYSFLAMTAHSINDIRREAVSTPQGL
jgi:hypothetical protein